MPDPVEMIRKIYHGGKGGVPYPTFLACFNALLEPGTPLRAKPPAPELKDKFEAVCMAMNAGIEDSLGREKDREADFHNVLWPAWQKGCDPVDVDHYYRIINGLVRKEVQADRDAVVEEMQERRRQEQKIDLEEERRAEARIQAEKKRLFEELQQLAEAKGEDPDDHAGDFFPPPATHAVHYDHAEAWSPAEPGEEAHAATGLDLQAPTDEAAQPPAETPAPPPAEAPEQQEEVLPQPRVFDTLDHLVESVQSGEQRIVFTRERGTAPYLYFRWHEHVVEVKLSDAGNALYVILSFPLGHHGQDYARRKFENVMSDIGYTAAEPDLYEKMVGRDKCKVKLGPKLTRVALKRTAQFSNEQLIVTIRTLRDLMEHCLKRVPRLLGSTATPPPAES
jgi:hypothetical protein